MTGVLTIAFSNAQLDILSHVFSLEIEYLSIYPRRHLVLFFSLTLFAGHTLASSSSETQLGSRGLIYCFKVFAGTVPPHWMKSAAPVFGRMCL